MQVIGSAFIGLGLGLMLFGVFILARGAYLDLRRKFREHRRNHRDHRSAGSGEPDLTSSITVRTGTDSTAFTDARATGPHDGPAVLAGEGAGLEPIRAWKGANFAVVNGKLWFAGVGAGSLYGVEAVAECTNGNAHRAPAPPCSCGFYALPLESDLSASYRGVAWLEVELYGRVIVGTKGYRAEKQRVLAAHVWDDVNPLICWCSGVARWVTSDGRPICTRCALTERRKFAELNLLDKLHQDLPTDWTIHATPRPGESVQAVLAVNTSQAQSALNALKAGWWGGQ